MLNFSFVVVVGIHSFLPSAMSYRDDLGEPSCFTPARLYDSLKGYHFSTHVHHFHEGPHTQNVQTFLCCSCRVTIVVTDYKPGRTLSTQESMLHPAHHWHKESSERKMRFSCCSCKQSFACAVYPSPIEARLKSLRRLDDVARQSVYNLAGILISSALDKPETRQKPVLMNGQRFRTSIGTVPGGVELLESCGFQRAGTADSPTLVLPADFSLVEETLRLAHYNLSFEKTLFEISEKREADFRMGSMMTYVEFSLTFNSTRSTRS